MRSPTPAQLNLAWMIALRVVGLGGVVWQVVVEHAERPTLLLLLAAMIGLPEFVKLDRSRKRESGGDGDGGTKP